MESRLDDEFASLLAYHKWKKYFDNWKSGECNSELLEILQLSAIPPRNVYIEWVFPLMQVDREEPESSVNQIAVIPIEQFQRNFLYRFPCLPEDQCNCENKH
jgi:hypothetical protein